MDPPHDICRGTQYSYGSDEPLMVKSKHTGSFISAKGQQAWCGSSCASVTDLELEQTANDLPNDLIQGMLLRYVDFEEMNKKCNKIFLTSNEILITERGRAIRNLILEEINNPPRGRSENVTFLRLQAMLKKELKRGDEQPPEKGGLSDVAKLELNVLRLELIEWILVVRARGEMHEYWEKRFQADLFIERLVDLTAKRCERYQKFADCFTKQSIDRLRRTLQLRGWYLSVNEQVTIVSNHVYIKLLICKYQLHLYRELMVRHVIVHKAMPTDSKTQLYLRAILK
ncbi:hypothetical protein Ciccas_011107 [Cichlidogyrus casuarinus]|uniref:Uncharacterized protein n=1 Tax=Cichlidogyrus casuarinus TaxID=1844966 RepID=A0ABD2PT08_9PLAT